MIICVNLIKTRISGGLTGVNREHIQLIRKSHKRKEEAKKNDDDEHKQHCFIL